MNASPLRVWAVVSHKDSDSPPTDGATLDAVHDHPVVGVMLPDLAERAALDLRLRQDGLVEEVDGGRRMTAAGAAEFEKIKAEMLRQDLTTSVGLLRAFCASNRGFEGTVTDFNKAVERAYPREFEQLMTERRRRGVIRPEMILHGGAFDTLVAKGVCSKLPDSVQKYVVV